ncbi:MAG TPA: hypothetical protein VME19_07405 [Streptosporangiaceae bacterium]|nr:hypothetical protein [Streptosporangiaceae bacterium]
MTNTIPVARGSGAAYRSEFAAACDHCRSPRPVAWGSWVLTQIMLVEVRA